MTSTRRGVVHWAVAAFTAGLCAALPGARSTQLHAPRDTASEVSGLLVQRNGVWTRWWDASHAPAHWVAPLATVTDAIDWLPTSNGGVQWGELKLSGPGEAWRVRVIIARIDPHQVRFRLDTAFGGAITRPAWTVGHAPSNAIVAVNAGQFVGSLPWGWVVLDGHQFLKSGRGPLATAIVFDSSNSIRWLGAGDMTAAPPIHGVADAFQSYPTLLRDDGTVPKALQSSYATPSLDIEHRDARLAIGQSRDGHVLIALTRFDALDGTFDYIPFGLTTPEMAAVMGALGCRVAVMLDGGISSQMMIRRASGEAVQWRGIRRVPLGLVVLPRN